MALLDIVTYPDPRLNVLCTPQENFDASLHKLLDDMYQTMLEASGVGLAAPQIGVLHRITVIDISEDRNERLELINPKIVDQSGKTSSEEGCLSIPDYRDSLTRYQNISVEALDRYGKPISFTANGLLGICIQHEIDHLDGILFVDRLSRLKREYFKRWAKKRGMI